MTTEDSKPLSPGPVPSHIAIIMDGNGRWAQQRGLPRLQGHAEGAKAVRKVVTAAREVGVKALTLYAFSAQNWARPPKEIEGLMQQLFDYLYEERQTMLDNEIRLRSIGSITELPDHVRKRQKQIENETKHCKQMVLTLALSYGGREEILQATQAIASKVASGDLLVDDIDEACVGRHLYTSHLPDLDLVIRTSGEIRLSNFLLWQAAYSEFIFMEEYWPDFGEQQLFKAIEMYRKRKRRFGQTDAQISEAVSS
ncbi:MAG: isoprenyl transferase [Myxococcota bacterium]|nr:isoprenyl transferase [Myxococcota bacterium]